MHKGIFIVIFIRLFAQTDLCQFWLVGLSSIEYHITCKCLFCYLGLIWTSKGWERIDSDVFWNLLPRFSSVPFELKSSNVQRNYYIVNILTLLSTDFGGIVDTSITDYQCKYTANILKVLSTTFGSVIITIIVWKWQSLQ